MAALLTARRTLRHTPLTADLLPSNVRAPRGTNRGKAASIGKEETLTCNGRERREASGGPTGNETSDQRGCQTASPTTSKGT